ncbi:DeoR/GlpR transcriptional regulator [Candidatus Bipolaricaulota bacterium]|nr:DeoR/GlpR transcriptional regulator [Candidatus Bipolaricaulota bacterium]
MTDILAEERRRKILEKIAEEGTVKTSQLAHAFSVSEVTIRRDLQELTKEGKLEKVHGGAVAKEKDFESSYHGETITFEPSFQEKSKVHREQKQSIGEKASTLIKDGSSVFIGTGTTTMQIVKNLDGKKGLTIVTNSLNHGLELSRTAEAEVLMTGGELRTNTSALVGPIAKHSLDELYVDTMFLGVNGISVEQGYTVPSLREADMARRVTRMSNDVIIVADFSKFGKVSHAKIGSLDDVDTIVTDDGLDPSYRSGLADLGVELLIARKEGGG